MLDRIIDKILRLTSASMSMSEEVWFRHANPWSGWTRFATYPFVILAFWSRAWIGIWFLIPVAVVFIWAWLNPRIFAKPKSTNNWMSKGVFGEKIFTERKKTKTSPVASRNHGEYNDDNNNNRSGNTYLRLSCIGNMAYRGRSINRYSRESVVCRPHGLVI